MRAAADALAQGMNLPVGVVRVIGSDKPTSAAPMAWLLRTDEPARPLLNFARLSRARHIVLGPKAWESWGQTLWKEGTSTGELALSWGIPDGERLIPGVSLDLPRPGRWRRLTSFLKRFSLVTLVLGLSGIASAQSDSNLKRQVEDLQKRLEQLEAAGKARASRLKVPQSKAEPFAFADFTWLNGNSRVKDPLINNEYFTSQFQADVNYVYSFNNPKDHTLVGACEMGRTNEVQLQQLGIGGDLHYGNVRGRLMTQFGMYSQMTPRNDSSPGRGQWKLDDAYRHISEGYGGYHWDALHGVNLDAGIFMSYVGLFSYYQNENWAYMPSYVSANTPWFFNGLRAQIFPIETLKIELWLVNGFQTYGKQNEDFGYGLQMLWRPSGRWSILSNNYWGHDTPGLPRRQRWHTDSSMQYKYFEAPNALGLSKAAFSVTADAGCEEGAGVSCFGDGGRPQQSFLGWMLYNRTWFRRDLFGLTLGGGQINNPGRYLVLLPPINGATGFSGTSGQFTQNSGDKFKAWDASVTFDYMPNQYVTWRAEYNHREANVPYFAGSGGVTPPGGNQGAPGSLVTGFTPDLRKAENRVTLALLVRL